MKGKKGKAGGREWGERERKGKDKEKEKMRLKSHDN